MASRSVDCVISSSISMYISSPAGLLNQADTDLDPSRLRDNQLECGDQTSHYEIEGS